MSNESFIVSGESSATLSLSDKITGVLAEPVSFFKQLSLEKPRALNWLIPLLVLVVISSATNYIMINNPVIRGQAVDKQMAIIEKALDDAVAAGQIPQEVADTQREQYRERIEQQIESGTLITVASQLIVIFLLFFIVSGVFHLLSRFALKGEGSYATALSAYGSAFYILILQVIAILITALLSDKLVTGINPGLLLDIDSKEFGGFLLSKVDPFTIWFYLIVSIGFAKLYKSDSTGKYFLIVFATWIGFSLLFFIASRQFPFLQMFM